MEDFDISTLQPYIFLCLGLAAILFSILKKTKAEKLKFTGEKTEGIIFELDSKADLSTYTVNDTNDVMDKVTVRFVTKNKEWITGNLKQEFAIFFTGQYKTGESVEVYYDPKN